MIYAIIDLGTNTFNLLIAEAKGNSYIKFFGNKIVVKLGEGGFGNKFIEKIPFQRGINAMLQHKKTIEKYNADKIFAFATSAIRDAKNGMEFTGEAKSKTGIEIKIISGEKEAELIYFGVRQAVDLGKEKSLIMDIGGGSTEFIIADSEKIFRKFSFQLGVSRLLEKFNPSDPIKNSEIKIIEDYFERELQPLFNLVNSASSGFQIRNLIGSSGSFDSFADMIAHRFYSPEILKGKTNFTFGIQELSEIHSDILKSNLNERLQMKGLVKFRADNIVLASILTQFVINKLNIKSVRLSTYALKEGVLWAILNNQWAY